MAGAMHGMVIVAVMLPILNGTNGWSFGVSLLLAVAVAGGFATLEHFNPRLLQASRGSAAFRIVTPIAFMLTMLLLGMLTLVMRWF